MTIFEDLLSGDPTRIWSGAGAVLRSWDLVQLRELALHIPEIRKKTAGVPLGGALHPNSVHLDNAIARLEHVRDQRGCLCVLYASDQFSDPAQEAERGNVRISETQRLDGGHVDYYTCVCLHCGTRYRVTEREYHYTSWGWSRI
jgi:hypothetical protein